MSVAEFTVLLDYYRAACRCLGRYDDEPEDVEREAELRSQILAAFRREQNKE